MSLRTQENLNKTNYPGENRGMLPVICPAYCQKCHRLFMPKTAVDNDCPYCGDRNGRTNS